VGDFTPISQQSEHI